ncbi:MAG: Azurin [Myxococcales bacterium FL481]|nr:MAG: Azurin [Myxococcales bacterium FL481]
MRNTTFACIFALLAPACGQGDAPAPKAKKTEAADASKGKKDKKAEKKAAAPKAAKPAGGAELTPDAEGVIRLTGDDLMKFNANKISVKAGSKVKVELKHIGKMPKTAMGHNFVLLKSGSDVQAFGTKSATAAATDYIPPDLADQVIVSSKVVGGGESVTIEFDAPAAGTYKFLCSFPGHFGTMQGDFVVS